MSNLKVFTKHSVSNSTISFLVLAIFLISLFACSSIKRNKPKVSIQSYVGHIYSEYDSFPGFKFIEGRTLIYPDEKFAGNEYAVSVYEKGQKLNIVFFEEIVRADSGQVKYVILDQLVIREESKKENLILSCSSQLYPSTEIICLCSIEEDEWYNLQYFDNVIKAWRMNRKTARIEEINPAEIRAVNSSFGI